MFFGNLLDIGKYGQVPLEKEWLANHGKLYGSYMITDPVLNVIDADLIKTVLVKDFHVFVNRDKQPFVHEIWSKNLFNSEVKFLILI